MSIRQTLFRKHWVLCPSGRHCFLCTWALCPSYTLFLMHWGFCPSERYCFLRAWPVVIRLETKNGTWHHYRPVSSITLWQKKWENWPALYSSGIGTSGPWNGVIALFSNSCLNNSWPVTMEAEDTPSGFPFTHWHFCLKCHVIVPFPCIPWKVCLCVLLFKQNGFCVRYLLYGIT